MALIYEIPETNEGKFERFKRKAKRNVQEALDWAGRNKETLLIVVPAVVGVTTATVKTVGKRINLRKQEDVKNLYCYDRSLGHYWALRRELSNKEWLDIDRRKKNGERLSDILEELRVLK